MPYLAIRTNQPAPGDLGGLLREASGALAALLGKPERYVMVSLEAGVPMLFAGSQEAAAYLELKSIGLPEARTADLSAALCDLIHRRLGVARERIYIEFANAHGPLWGWNGDTF